jgi:hypothetical protein
MFIIFKYLWNCIMFSEFGLVNEVTLNVCIKELPKDLFILTHYVKFLLLHFLIKCSHWIIRILHIICNLPSSKPCQVSPSWVGLLFSGLLKNPVIVRYTHVLARILQFCAVFKRLWGEKTRLNKIISQAICKII